MRGSVQIILGVLIGAAGALWAGPFHGVLPNAARQALGDFAAPLPVALVAAGGLYIITGLVTMVFAGVAKLFAQGAERKAEAHRLDLFHELLTGAIVRMVGVDGVIAPPELAMVTGVLEKFGQQTVPEKTIRSISESFVKNPDRYLELMADRGHEVSDEQKTHILRACLLVAMADVVLDATELDYLNRVAEALKVTPERLGKIRDELTNVTQKLVGAAAFAA